MYWASFLRTFQRALDAAQLSLSPPDSASPKEIRKNGAVCIAIGCVCFILGGLLLLYVPAASKVPMLPILLAYAFIIVGSYRLIVGKKSTAAHPGEVSISRILFGVLSMMMAMAVVFGFIAIGMYFFPDQR